MLDEAIVIDIVIHETEIKSEKHNRVYFRLVFYEQNNLNIVAINIFL